MNRRSFLLGSAAITALILGGSRLASAEFIWESGHVFGPLRNVCLKCGVAREAVEDGRRGRACPDGYRYTLSLGRPLTRWRIVEDELGLKAVPFAERT